MQIIITKNQGNSYIKTPEEASRGRIKNNGDLPSQA
jgi:hypothetical protein